MITTCQYANFILFPRNVILFEKMEAIDKIRRNSVRNEALNDFLRSISDFCDRFPSDSSLPLSSIKYGIRPSLHPRHRPPSSFRLYKRGIKIKGKIFNLFIS